MNNKNKEDDLEALLEGIPEERKEEIRELIVKDYLTGAYNRRTFDKDLIKRISWADRENTYLNLLVIDADDFKKHNTMWRKGESLLKEIATTLKKYLRRGLEGEVYRFGGDEYAAMVLSKKPEQGVTVARRLKDGVEKDFKDSGLTVSIGVVTYKPQKGDLKEKIKNLLDQVNIAVDSKQKVGKNSVIYVYS